MVKKPTRKQLLKAIGRIKRDELIEVFYDLYLGKQYKRDKTNKVYCIFCRKRSENNDMYHESTCVYDRASKIVQHVEPPAIIK